MKPQTPTSCPLLLVLVSLVVVSADSDLKIVIPRFGFIKDMEERVAQHMAPNYLLMPHIYRSFINAGADPEFLSNHSVSASCQSGLEQYYNGLIDKQPWAWKMYDSTGKQAAGVFIGATTWAGNFEECLNIEVTSCVSGQGVCREPHGAVPQFCSVHMTHAPWRPKLIEAIKLPFPVPYSPFIVDVCVPKSCLEEDIFNVVNAFLEIDNFGDNITVKHVNCHMERRIGEDPAALVSVIVLCVILGLVVAGTTYDIYRRRSKLRIKRGPEMTIGYDHDSDRYGILKIIVPTRRRHSRRGTLSSSENIMNAMNKEGLFNSSEKAARERSASEVLYLENGSVGLMSSRKLSIPVGHVELKGIPEDAEKNDASETLLPTESPIEGSHKATAAPFFASDEEIGVSAEAKNGMSTQSINENSVPAGVKDEPHVNRQASIIEVRPSHQNKKLMPSRNILTDLLLSFSFRKNTRHILAEGSADTLFCLNGVRVFSIAWIVLGNVYGIIYQNPDILDNSVSAVRMTQTWWMQMVINTTFAADSFFVLSGTLMAYNFLKLKTKAGRHKERDWSKVMSIREYGFMIVHRLFRIFPCFAVLLILATNLMPYMGRGPRWSYEIDSVKVCKKNWWANALFISNFYDPDNMCQPHTYYLANDFQFFLFSPLVLIPLLIAPKFGLGLVSFFVVAQIVVVGTLNQGINGNVLRMKVNNYFSLIYVKPYSRVGIYCIGLALGYLLFSCDRHMKFRKIPLYAGWIISCLVIIILPYITYLENMEGGQPWTGTQTALYEAFSRPAWAIALSWVIFACSTGQGAFVGKLLSWNIFLPLCRITYGVFLLHPIIISVIIESAHHNFYLNLGELVYTYIAMLVCCWGVAFILISCVECPFTTFESHIRLRFKAWIKDRKLKNLQRL